jgi:hypothetical protein
VRARHLAVAAVAFLAAVPFSGAVAATSITDLPNALANAVETNLVEYTAGSVHVHGFFDASQFADWAGNDAASRQRIHDELISNGFVTGYQRVWFGSATDDSLFETVFVFAKESGASTMLSGERDLYAGSTQFRAWVPVQLNGASFAMQEVDSNAHWTFAGFTKGNDAFVLFRGSSADFMTPQALAQLTEMYTLAPDGTRLGAAPPAPQSALSRFRTPIVITVAIGALMLAVAVAIAGVATVIPRKPRPNAMDLGARP